MAKINTVRNGNLGLYVSLICTIYATKTKKRKHQNDLTQILVNLDSVQHPNMHRAREKLYMKVHESLKRTNKQCETIEMLCSVLFQCWFWCWFWCQNANAIHCHPLWMCLWMWNSSLDLYFAISTNNFQYLNNLTVFYIVILCCIFFFHLYLVVVKQPLFAFLTCSLNSMSHACVYVRLESLTAVRGSLSHNLLPLHYKRVNDVCGCEGG